MLKHLFKPMSVAVIGASKDTTKLGSVILRNIVERGYDGEIYPINPNADNIMGLKAYPSISNVNEVQLVVIATSAKDVFGALKECVESGVRAALVFSSGFGELTDAGKRLEMEMVSVAAKAGLRFVGPNSVGIFSSSNKLHAMMPDIVIKEGEISLVTQSGNVGSQMLFRGGELGLGFDVFVSSGNEADLHCEDYIEYLRNRPETKVILSYIEGLSDARRFLETARRTTLEKPVIVIKGGETEAGADVVKSHTGSLAGSEIIYDAALRQAGVIKADTMEDLLDFAVAFNCNRYPGNRKVAVLTRGGGWGVIAADACEKAGLELPQLPADMVTHLDRILPPYWNRKNPIDTVMAPGFSLMNMMIDMLGKWEEIEGLIILGGFGAYFTKIWKEKEPDKVSRKMIEISCSKVIFGVSFALKEDSQSTMLLRENGIPVYDDANRAINAYSKLVEYQEYSSLRNPGAGTK